MGGMDRADNLYFVIIIVRHSLTKPTGTVYRYSVVRNSARSVPDCSRGLFFVFSVLFCTIRRV
jgi:hypothetical protein